MENNYKVRILQSDLDFTFRPAFVCLCKYILSVAGRDAEKNGCGIDVLTAEKHSWVLLRMTNEWYRLPLNGEVIFVETWVSEVNRLMTTRNFIVRDEDNNIIGGATTSWAMIDVDTRQAVDLRANTSYMNLLVNEPSIVTAARKLNAVSGGECREHGVCYSDLDFNKHCNTMRYIEWMCDMLPIESLRDSFVRRFEVHFFHEARYDEMLSVSMNADADKSNFEIKNQDQTIICRATITI